METQRWSEPLVSIIWGNWARALRRLPVPLEPSPIGIEPLCAHWASSSEVEGRHVDSMVTAPPTAYRNDLLGRTFPVESLDFDLLSDDERREWTLDALLEHDQEGPVLLIFPVRVDERLLDEMT